MTQTLVAPVVGLAFKRGSVDFLRTLSLPYACALRAEPDNKFDANAVAVEVEGFGDIGYVSKDVKWNLANNVEMLRHVDAWKSARLLRSSDGGFRVAIDVA